MKRPKRTLCDILQRHINCFTKLTNLVITDSNRSVTVTLNNKFPASTTLSADLQIKSNFYLKEHFIVVTKKIKINYSHPPANDTPPPNDTLT